MQQKSKQEVFCLSLQYCPVLGKIDKSIAIVDKLLAKYEGNPIDFLILPEMALTGYELTGKEMLEEVSETSSLGPQFTYFQGLAKRLNCYVFAGYPEKCGTSYYNSMYCIDREGHLIRNYRKTFLFDTDKPLYLPGDGFSSVNVVTLGGKSLKMAVAICMDINPWEFNDMSKFELADYCNKIEADGLIFCSNWCTLERTTSKETIGYWIYRMSPVIEEQEKQTLKANPKGQSQKKFLFLCANRTGVENQTLFVGSSCHISLPSEVHGFLDMKSTSGLYSIINL